MQKGGRGPRASSRSRNLKTAPASPATGRSPTVHSALQLLLTPVSSDGLDAWRKEVIRTLCQLLGADRGVFSLNAPGVEELCSEDYPPPVLKSYAEYYREIDIGRIRRERLGLEVWNRELIHDGGLSRFEESEIYRDFLAPNRICDSMGMTVSVPGAGAPATLFLHNERRGTRNFGGAGLALLRNLLPAFKSGVREAVRYSHQKVSLANHLDALAEGMRICALSGVALHQNRAFTRTLAREPHAEKLDAAARELAHELVRLLRSRQRGGQEPAITAKRVIRKVATETGHYELRGTYGGRALFTEDISIAITLLPLAPRTSLSDETLQRRFGLTARQLEIARRLARGQPNKEIAHACGISLHTVRRHAEKIFAKLGANTRGQIGAKLRGD